jgi:protein SCO1/2
MSLSMQQFFCRAIAGLIILSLLTWALVFAQSCQYEPEKLPILGEKDIVDGDTIYHTVPDFVFVNQDSQLVSNASFEGQAYIVDFFFTSCPTICPKVKRQMLRLYERYEKEDRIALLSHSIDVRRDTVGRLKAYAENMGVKAPKWHLVTGDKDALYGIADDYFSSAVEDATAPGGFDHSGRLILVDSRRRVRAFCDGTDPESVDQFMKDIELLLRTDM